MLMENGKYPITSNLFAVYALFLYFSGHGQYMNYKVIAFLIVCIAVIAAAGCLGLPSGNFVKSSSSQEVVTVSPDSAGSGLSEERIVWSGSTGTPAVPMPSSVPTPSRSNTGSGSTDTKIIRTAYLSVEVKDVPAAVDSLTAIATAEGGYLSSSNVQKDSSNRVSGTVVLRVPAAVFDAAVSGVKAVGVVNSISTQGEDVTEEYVDLQAQKTSYQNQLAQYNEIMKKSEKVEDIIKVQEQIDLVQTELDRLNGRLNYLNNRIDISTITVNLQEPEPVGSQSEHDFVSTINEGISGFLGMVDAIIVLFLTLLPLIIIGGIGYEFYRWYKGRQGSAPIRRDDKKE